MQMQAGLRELDSRSIHTIVKACPPLSFDFVSILEEAYLTKVVELLGLDLGELRNDIFMVINIMDGLNGQLWHCFQDVSYLLALDI